MNEWKEGRQEEKAKLSSSFNNTLHCKDRPLFLLLLRLFHAIALLTTIEPTLPATLATVEVVLILDQTNNVAAS